MRLVTTSFLPVAFVGLLVAACGGSSDVDPLADGDDISADEIKAASAVTVPLTANLYPQPHTTPKPSCDVHTRLVISTPPANAHLVNEVTRGAAPGCPIDVDPDSRDYRLSKPTTECGSLHYKTTMRKGGKKYAIEIADHRKRTCRDLLLAKVIVTETITVVATNVTRTSTRYGEPDGTPTPPGKSCDFASQDCDDDGDTIACIPPNSATKKGTCTTTFGLCPCTKEGEICLKAENGDGYCVKQADCTVDADCHLHDNYCHLGCDAGKAGATFETCPGHEVMAIMAPCTTKKAACVEGACVAVSR